MLDNGGELCKQCNALYVHVAIAISVRSDLSQFGRTTGVRSCYTEHPKGAMGVHIAVARLWSGQYNDPNCDQSTTWISSDHCTSNPTLLMCISLSQFVMLLITWEATGVHVALARSTVGTAQRSCKWPVDHIGKHWTILDDCVNNAML